MIFLFAILIMRTTTTTECFDPPHQETMPCRQDCDCAGILSCDANNLCVWQDDATYYCQKQRPDLWDTGLGGEFQSCSKFDKAYIDEYGHPDSYHYDQYCSGRRAMVAPFGATVAEGHGIIGDHLFIWQVCPECDRCTPQPTVLPTVSPSFKPSEIPSRRPSTLPSASPTLSDPTVAPSSRPTKSPSSSFPSASPTFSDPTVAPSSRPTKSPSSSFPSAIPSRSPSASDPSMAPSSSPSASDPSSSPSASDPSASPSASPSTSGPSIAPSKDPSNRPTTSAPTTPPTEVPSSTPSISSPTLSPVTSSPSIGPSSIPSNSPSISFPTASPETSEPTVSPTSTDPTDAPSTSQPTTSKPTPAPTQFTVQITLEGDYDEVITDKSKWLRDCSARYFPVECADVWKGSIILQLRGDEDEVRSTESEIVEQGLNIEGWPALTVATDEQKFTKPDEAEESSFPAWAMILVCVGLLSLLAFSVHYAYNKSEKDRLAIASASKSDASGSYESTVKAEGAERKESLIVVDEEKIGVDLLVKDELSVEKKQNKWSPTTAQIPVRTPDTSV